MGGGGMSGPGGLDACLECGRAITGSASLVCSAGCGALIRLVRYGRTRKEWDNDPDELNRLRRQAGVLGRFPTPRVVQRVLERDGNRCQVSACTARVATCVGWVDQDPNVRERVRVRDLRTLCDTHHASEDRHVFIGPSGQSARTAPAVWARMTADEPLVLRDDAAIWEDPSNLTFLSHWPLASAQTRRDLGALTAAIRDGRPGSRDRDAGDALSLEGAELRMNAALDSLALPARRRDRVVRAFYALILRLRADEVAVEAMGRVVSEAKDASRWFDTEASAHSVASRRTD